MSDYDSNYNSLRCPYCKKLISENKGNISDNQVEELWVYDLEDENEDFFQCQHCEKFFKAELNIHKELEYIISKPTKEEIKQHGLIVNKDIIEDCPGQKFMWKDLFLKNYN